MATRKEVVTQAISMLGKNEIDGSFKEIIDIYNRRKPYARGYKMKYSDEWCAAFVSAVSIKCGATNIMPTECGCERMIALYKKLKCWQEKDSFTPSAGDLIFYNWDDGGKGDTTGNADHVGIVEQVVGGLITIIEGNYERSVKRRVLPINARYIRGFATPKFSATIARKTSADIAREVVKGEWGNGLDRKERITAAGFNYAEVQYIVNTLIKRRETKQ